MPDSPGAQAADTAGRAFIAEALRDGQSDTQIANTLRVARWRVAPTIQAVRDDLTEAGADIPDKRGPWGHRRG